MKHNFFLLGIFALILVFASAAQADYIPPGEVLVKTKAYHPTDTNFSRGTYQYAVKWEGLPVARASIEVDSRFLDSAPFYSVTARANTGGLVGVFYKLRHESKSLFHADTLTPVEFHFEQTENSRQKAREVKFGANGNVAAKVWKDAIPTPDEHYEFRTDNAIFDPVSAAFVARSLPITLGEELTFDVFNGKHRFLISLNVEGRETIRVEGKSYDTFKVVPTVTKLTDTEGEKRLRSCAIWVTADERRDVVRIRSEVFIGSVGVDLIRFIPGPVADPGMVRAALGTTGVSNSGERESDKQAGKQSTQSAETAAQ